MVKMIRLDLDGTVEAVDVPSTYPALNDTAFAGGLVEVVHTPRLTDRFAIPPRIVALVDEEGRLKGLQPNENATRLYVPLVYRTSITDIRGTAFIAAIGRQADGETGFIDLPDEVTVEALTELIDLFEDH